MKNILDQFTIKDVIQFTGFVLTMIAFSFMAMQKLEGRVLVLETDYKNMHSDVSEIKADVKQILRESRKP